MNDQQLEDSEPEDDALAVCGLLDRFRRDLEKDSSLVPRRWSATVGHADQDIVDSLEILRLLQNVRRCSHETDAVFDEPAFSTFATHLRAPIEPAAPPSGRSQALADASPTTPSRIGKYLVVQEMDAGGQGRVFRVLHPTLRTDLALKLGRKNVAADAVSTERMLREGQLLVECEHPNLVRIVDFDFHEGYPFLVMDRVPGCNLEQFTKDRRVSPRQAARIVAELAQAVAYIHGRGIIHLDIKPSNVVVDARNQPRLIDFGMALMRDAWHDDTSGSIGGTVSYMSPEQALGRADKIGPGTDVFGLGGLLYHLLTGRPLYKSASRSAALRQASEADQIPARAFNPSVPPLLERICRKALAPHPADRFRCADELERALRRFLARGQIAAAGFVVAALVALAFLLQASRPWASNPAATPALAASGAADIAITAPRIVTFEVRHFRGYNPPVSLGTVSDSPGSLLLNDDVRVHARLERPAYCFLIALNPDGNVQLCHPSKVTAAPPKSAEIFYPDDDFYFPLTDGAGLQAFVLLASRQPLPPFGAWNGRDRLQWRSIPTDNAVVWSFDGHTLEALSSTRRGEPRQHDGAPVVFRQLCNDLAALPDVTVKAFAFAVRPNR